MKAQDIASWIEKQVAGDYSQSSLDALHLRVRDASLKEKNPKRKQDLQLLAPALKQVASERLFTTTPEMEAIDPASLS